MLKSQSGFLSLARLKSAALRSYENQLIIDDRNILEDNTKKGEIKIKN